MSSDKVDKKKQKQKLLIDGHYFIKLKELKNTTKWCCDKKGTLNCKSIVTTKCSADGSYDIKDGPTEHNHEDPKNRKLIVATPRKSIIGKGKNRKYSSAKLDFQEISLTSENEQADTENTTNNIDSSQRPRGKKCKVRVPYTDQPIEPDFGVKQIKFFKWSENANEKLFVDGFYYNCKRVGMTTCEWVCTKQFFSSRCLGRIMTTFTSGAHRLKYGPDLYPHNHDKEEIPKSLKGITRKATNFWRNESTENMADVSMHTQLLSRIPQADVVEFPPPNDGEIEFTILFGRRRQLTPEQIYYELQSIYGSDAPSFETVFEHCKRFQSGYYPTNDSEFRNRKSDIHSMNLSKFNDDPNISRELLTVQPDLNTSNALYDSQEIK